ncbi:LLM class flavin-dependent oxidoreductase [Rhodovarius crocodyli]|uniref:LLM class flavin-dependent oxidoreductase n=1 Tax=Rhodovarius crocodyli TaxID=1979269 RepID=A0A437MNV9_9PROT|nr:LLM class flavin-dependent oxidoreductase [Rhodovarius crocodyli]RVT99300.1 LLM class flavin-dependent oxidoreductase [Rhodovarius crocodyli]
MTSRSMKLGLNLVANGAHGGGWRMPDSLLGSAMDIGMWKTLAKEAERAKFHLMFWADGMAVRSSAKDDTQLSYDSRIDVFEPMTLLSALSAVTEHMGYIATVSTTYYEPFTVARLFASLDHISEGRVGWNVVTSWSEQEALNYNRDKHMEHGARYRRAQEFVDVVFGLWDSYEDDAFIRNQATGQYFDPAKIHVPDHKGEHFKVRGPLNARRPIQGYPVIVQAGSSGPGQDLAGRIAELVYTMQKSLPEAQAFYAGVKEKVVAHGRRPEHSLIMPGMMPIMADTMQEARDLQEQLQELIHPQLGLAALYPSFGDLSGYDLDAPVPALNADTNSLKSEHAKLARQLAANQGLTIRQLINQRSASGHHVIVGTPESIADEMTEWFLGHGCDGWNILPPYFPGPVRDIFEKLIPALQRRGVFHTEYEGKTLRENLGLPRPEHPARRRAAAAE